LSLDGNSCVDSCDDFVSLDGSFCVTECPDIGTMNNCTQCFCEPEYYLSIDMQSCINCGGFGEISEDGYCTCDIGFMENEDKSGCVCDEGTY